MRASWTRATFAVDSAGFAGPMLLAQCDTRFVLSDVKLALLEVLPPEHEVIVLKGLGLPDEQLVPVALARLDQSIEPDHLTSVFVDTGGVSVAGELARLLALTERLRGPGGCPWDAEQTHHSLRRHVLEEAYEVAAAIDELPPDAPGGEIPAGAYDALEDELGDLLFQVMIHSVLATEAGAFGIADVASGVHAKLVRRHPHVFGDVEAGTPAEVVDQLGADQEEREGPRVARRGHHARAARADLRAEAPAQGVVDRARARTRCDRARSPTKPGSARRWPRWSGPERAWASTASRRSARGPADSASASSGWNSSRSTRMSTSPRPTSRRFAASGSVLARNPDNAPNVRSLPLGARDRIHSQHWPQEFA